MHDLRRMGATNVLVERRRIPLRRATLLRMAEIYAERFSDPDGRVRATFEIVWLSGWAPHESQQQPLKPGSATTRLADALEDEGNIGGRKARLVTRSVEGLSTSSYLLLSMVPSAENACRDHDGNAARDHRIFDCGRTVLVARETFEGSLFSGFIQRFSVEAFTAASSGARSSGSSAGGIL